MKAGNFALELAEFRIDEEREAGIARIRNELNTAGTFTCIDCDRPIPVPRRAAYPSARRCASCQTRHEHEMRKSA